MCNIDLPCLVLADPSEYGRIRRHCVTFYKDCLTGLQAFFDLCSNASLQKYGSDIYERLRDALAALDDLTARWWRVLTLPKGRTLAWTSPMRGRISCWRTICMLVCCDGLAWTPVCICFEVQFYEGFL